MEPHTLLGFQAVTNPQGITTLTLHARDAGDGRIYRTVLNVEPHVADALRLTVQTEIPERPLDRLTTADIVARHEAFSDLVTTIRPATADSN